MKNSRKLFEANFYANKKIEERTTTSPQNEKRDTENVQNADILMFVYFRCECRSDPRVNGGPRVNVMEEPGGPHKLNVNDDPHVKIKMMV
ncbi:hypothetical protein M8J77_018079 [Diaphorina citri]|nr:hypothetical protein M8J77_018079 [Diaphorina citri]